MTHVERDRLLARLDGELPDRTASRVDRHLDGCPRCRARLDRLRERSDRLSGALRTLDVPAPDRDPRRIRQRAEEDREPAGSTSGALLKAAVLLLAVATAAGAAVPGSPVRDWIVDSVESLLGERAAAPAATQQEAATPEDSDRQAVSIPVSGRAVVTLRGVAPGLRLRVRIVEDPVLSVTGSVDRFETGDGSVEAVGAAGDDLLVEIPRGVTSGRISADGRLLLEIAEGRIRVHAPVADTTDDGLSLPLGSGAGKP